MKLRVIIIMVARWGEDGRFGMRSAHKKSRELSSRIDSLERFSDGNYLKRLTDEKLLEGLMEILRNERAAQVAVVKYLVEIERRRLYLPCGYASLFEFCTDYLGYSRSSAGRRIAAARCLARFPRVAVLFERGEIDLTVISLIAGVLTKENCKGILKWLKGRSLREVEAFAARQQPGRPVRDQVRQIYVMSPTGGAVKSEACSAVLAQRSGTSECSTENMGKSESHIMLTPSAGTKTAQVVMIASDKNPGSHASDRAELHDEMPCSSQAGTSAADQIFERVAVEQKFKIQFTVNPEFMKRLAQVKSMLSTRYLTGINLETIFDILMNEYLDRHDPEKRIARRNARKIHNRKQNKQLNTKQSISTPNRTSNRDTIKPRKIAERSRHIPQAVRDEVFERDGGRCSFIGSDGKRCGSRWDLEIDHIIPYAKGGDNSADNLRLLCAAHNKLEAEQCYGKEFMERYYRRE
jgi:5-methylcytosine-specific restriction endonuclease McrA